MQLTVQGKQIDVGDALRTHVETKLGDINSKFFNHAAYATVTFSKEGHSRGLTGVNILIKLGKDIVIVGEDIAGDPYGAFDNAAEKVAKQMRRYKRRLRDHHEKLEQTPESEILKARDYVLATGGAIADEDDEQQDLPAGDDPVIIAEISADIQQMSVSDAVMRMDLSGQGAMLFRNAKHGGLNMVYRRADGNIGWIDPGAEKSDAAEKPARRKSA